MCIALHESYLLILNKIIIKDLTEKLNHEILERKQFAILNTLDNVYVILKDNVNIIVIIPNIENIADNTKNILFDVILQA